MPWKSMMVSPPVEGFQASMSPRRMMKASPPAPAIHLVVAGPAHQDIAAGPTDQPVVAGTADQRVDPVAAIEAIRRRPASDLIIPGQSVDRIAHHGRSVVQDIVAGCAVDGGHGEPLGKATAPRSQKPKSNAILKVFRLTGDFY
jgi:hypothetical protein